MHVLSVTLKANAKEAADRNIVRLRKQGMKLGMIRKQTNFSLNYINEVLIKNL